MKKSFLIVGVLIALLLVPTVSAFSFDDILASLTPASIVKADGLTDCNKQRNTALDNGLYVTSCQRVSQSQAACMGSWYQRNLGERYSYMFLSDKLGDDLGQATESKWKCLGKPAFKNGAGEKALFEGDLNTQNKESSRCPTGRVWSENNQACVFGVADTKQPGDYMTNCHNKPSNYCNSPYTCRAIDVYAPTDIFRFNDPVGFDYLCARSDEGRSIQQAEASKGIVLDGSHGATCDAIASADCDGILTCRAITHEDGGLADTIFYECAYPWEGHATMSEATKAGQEDNQKVFDEQALDKCVDNCKNQLGGLAGFFKKTITGQTQAQCKSACFERYGSTSDQIINWFARYWWVILLVLVALYFLPALRGAIRF